MIWSSIKVTMRLKKAAAATVFKLGLVACVSGTTAICSAPYDAHLKLDLL